MCEWVDGVCASRPWLGVSGGGEYEHMYTDDDDALLASSDSDSHSSSIDDEDEMPTR